MLDRPVIFLHGNVGVGSDWDPVVSAFSDQGVPARFLTPTLWDYFSQHRDHPGFDDWVEWFCENSVEGGSKPVLVGYSLGGRLALHALAARPELIHCAVILCANTGLEPEEREERLKIDQNWSRQAVADWKTFLGNWEAQSLFVGGAALPDREGLVGWQEEIAAAFDAWSLGRQENLLPRLADITCPVLWVSGRHDGRFTRMAAAAASAMTHGESVIVSDAGHRVPWDQPFETARLISEFLQKVDRTN